MEPLADVITLLRPRAVGTKVIQGAERWAVRRSRMDFAGFGLVLIGECWLAVDGYKPVRLATGDFVLMPANPGFTMASDLACKVASLNAQEALACQAGEVRYGDPHLEADFKLLGGYFQLDSVNRNLLSGLLPTLVHIEASDPAAGRLKPPIDCFMRGRFPNTRAWGVGELARAGGLPRSAVSERFSLKVGVPPMQYLIDWRIALKAMLQRDAPPLEAVAAAIGYQSDTAFSAAF